MQNVEVAAGMADARLLQSWLPEDKDVQAYFLGPVGFMRVAQQALQQAGVPAAQCHYEFFGPAQALAA